MCSLCFLLLKWTNPGNLAIILVPENPTVASIVIESMKSSLSQCTAVIGGWWQTYSLIILYSGVMYSYVSPKTGLKNFF